MTVSKWSHIAMLGGDPWVLPLWNAINDCIREGRVVKPSPFFYQVGMSISIRFDMLPIIVDRINQEAIKLYSRYKNVDSKYVYEKNKEARAFNVDDELTYSLIIDINSLLFETNAVWELIKNLIQNVYHHFNFDIPGNLGKHTQSLLRAQIDQGWFDFMDKNRNYFLHEGTPYIAVDLTNADQSKYDLLIMKENLHHFEDKEKYIALSEINNMVRGFFEARMIVRDHLIKKIREFRQ